MLAIIFDSIGAGEWLVLLAVLLVVMGPKRLPSTARKIGSYYSRFRRAAESFKRQLMDMDLEMERELQKAEDEAREAVEFPDVPGKENGEGMTAPSETADVPAEEDDGDQFDQEP